MKFQLSYIKITIIGLLLFSSKIVTAQDTKPSPRKQTFAQSLILKNDSADIVIENRLVELALKQPQYQQTEYQRKAAEYQLTKEKRTWLNLLTLSTSYNDQTFAAKNTQTTAVYPKYFFGVNIPLGLIFSSGTDIKITRQAIEIAKDQQLELAKTIKASVLSYYKQYRANSKLLLIQNQVVNDAQAGFLQIEENFREGTVSLEAYNDASKKYNDEIIKVINLQLQKDLMQLEIERIIGRKLEDVLK